MMYGFRKALQSLGKRWGWGGKEAYEMPCSFACFLNDKQFICHPVMESTLDTLFWEDHCEGGTCGMLLKSVKHPASSSIVPAPVFYTDVCE